MTSLAVVFILLLVASLNNAGQQGQDIRKNMLVELQKAFKPFEKGGVRVESDARDPLSVLVLVPEGLLQFPFDKADIPPAGVQFLGEFTPILAQTTCSDRFRDSINSIVIEGHADNRGTDQANLERSQQRSLAVMIQTLPLLYGLPPAEQQTVSLGDCFKKLVSATGRGSAEPIGDPNSQADQDRSRRVVFKIRIRSIEQRDLIQVIGDSGRPKK